jgi:hypothetical protein
MARQRGYLTPSAARRVGRVVRDYESGDRDQPPIKFRDAGGDDDAVRMGTVAATWVKGNDATVTPIRADGTAIAGAATFTATNWFATVTVAAGTRKVACAWCDGRWILIAAEC